MNSTLVIKKLSLGLALAAGLAIGNRALANSLISYTSYPGADITFTGSGGFTFTTVSGSNFYINEGPGLSDNGVITGDFTLNSDSGTSATISGTGTVDIWDLAGDELTADLSWIGITQMGTSSGLNTEGTANLTDISYSGSQADLLGLSQTGSGSDTLTFSFNPAVTLSQLYAGGYSTTFSGSMASVPDSGATALLIGLGVVALGIGLMAQRRKASILQ